MYLEEWNPRNNNYNISQFTKRINPVLWFISMWNVQLIWVSNFMWNFICGNSFLFLLSFLLNWTTHKTQRNILLRRAFRYFGAPYKLYKMQNILNLCRWYKTLFLSCLDGHTKQSRFIYFCTQHAKLQIFYLQSVCPLVVKCQMYEKQ